MFKRLISCVAFMSVVSGCGSAPRPTATVEAPPLYTVDLTQIEFPKDMLGENWQRADSDKMGMKEVKPHPDAVGIVPVQTKEVSFFSRTPLPLSTARIHISKMASSAAAENWIKVAVRPALPKATFRDTSVSGLAATEFTNSTPYDKQGVYLQANNLIIFASSTDERSQKSLDKLITLALIKTGVVTENSAAK